MKKTLTAILASASAIGDAHFNAHAGWKLYICATPKPTDIADATAYAALTWIEIQGVGSHGETGTVTNMLTYDTWDDRVVQKAKGMTNAGDPEIEIARDTSDAGQDALRAAALLNLPHAFKIEAADLPTGVGAAPSKFYNRGYVIGPRRPHGRNEDFDIEIFTLGLVQAEIAVDPVVGV